MYRARISDIIALSAKAFKVKAIAIKGSRGNAQVCAARLAVYYIARLNTHTCTQIGRMLNDRDHSTVSDGARSCQNRMDADEKFRALVNKIAGQAASLPSYVMERREKIYRARVIPRSHPRSAEPIQLRPMPKPARTLPDDPTLDDIEWLSRRVAAHYAQAA